MGINNQIFNLFQLQVLLYIIYKIMISKLFSHTTHSLTYFRFLAKPQLFHFSTEATKGDQQFKLSNCTHIKDIIQYISKHKDQISDNEFNAICKKVNELRYLNPWDNVTPLMSKVRNIDLDKCNISYLANIAGMVSILNQNAISNYKFYKRLCEEISKVIKSNENLYNNEILKFLDAAIEFNDKQLIISLNKILLKRIGQLKFADYMLYLHIINRRKLGTKLQKEIFKIFSEKLVDQIQKIDYKFLINLYREIKKINKNVYDNAQIVKLLQDKLESVVQDLPEREAGYLIGYKANNNFRKTFIDRIMKSIDQNGESKIEAQSLLRLLNKIVQIERYRLGGGERQTKFMKFIDKNKDKVYLIQALMRKNFFSIHQLTQINEIYFKGDNNQFKTNPLLVYALVSRGILEHNNYRPFLSSLKENNPVRDLSEKYISSAMIAIKLNTIPKIISDEPDAKEVLDFFIKDSEGFKNNYETLKNVSSLQNHKILESYHRRFSKYYFNGVVDQMIEKNERMTINFLLYLVFSNDYRSFVKILKAKRQQFGLSSCMRVILQRVSAHPSKFIGTFDFINRALRDMQFDKLMVKPVINYLCNWQLHLLLNPDQVLSFLGVAQKIIAKDLIHYSKVANFLSYFSKSPTSRMRNNVEYIRLFQEIQNKQQPLGDLNIDGQRSNQNFPMHEVGTQLMRVNRMNSTYASKLVSHLKRDNILKDYCRIISGQKLDLNKLDFNVQENVILVVRSSNLNKEQVGKYLPQIKQAIQKCDCKQLQTILLNFTTKLNLQTSQILKSALNAYTKKIRPHNQSYKFDLIIHHLRNIGVFSPEYKAFLAKVMKYYIKNMHNLPTHAFEAILNECLHQGIECKEFVNKLMQFLNLKISKDELNLTSLKYILDSILLLTEPEQALKIYNLMVKNSFTNQIKIQLFSNLDLIDPLNDKFAEQTLRLLKVTKDFYLYEGVFRYLVAKNPIFAELEGQIKLVPVNENPLFQKIVNFIESKKIPFEKLNKYGYKLLKIGKKYVACSPRSYSVPVTNKLRDYYSTLFEIPAESFEDIVIVYTGIRMKSFHNAKLLSKQIEQLKENQQEILQVLMNRGGQRNAEQSTQNNPRERRERQPLRNSRQPNPSATQTKQQEKKQ